MLFNNKKSSFLDDWNNNNVTNCNYNKNIKSSSCSRQIKEKYRMKNHQAKHAKMPSITTIN